MRIGLQCLGIEPFVGPAWMATAGQTAEKCGFSSIFVGEHFAFFDSYKSPYPYLPGGDLPVPGSTDILDPFVTLTWLAAHTETIRLGTGVAIVPCRDPMTTAKQVASVDQLSGGRTVFGAGVGWSQEEYRAMGVPWERRWSRLDDYVAAMRCLWSTPVSTYHSEFTNFDEAFSHPKPKAGGDIPVFFGGNGDLTLSRVARGGQGWIGMNLTAEDAARKIKEIRAQAENLGRDPDGIEMTMLTSDWPNQTIDDLKRFHDAGIDELIEFGHSGLPVTADNAAAWVQDVARRSVDLAAAL
jgi:probable F420-dependent oxidoreductase